MQKRQNNNMLANRISKGLSPEHIFQPERDMAIELAGKLKTATHCSYSDPMTLWIGCKDER